MTTSSREEETEKNRRTETHFSSKGGGRHNLRHVGADVPGCLNITGAAASKKRRRAVRQRREKSKAGQKRGAAV